MLVTNEYSKARLHRRLGCSLECERQFGILRSDLLFGLRSLRTHTSWFYCSGLGKDG